MTIEDRASLGFDCELVCLLIRPAQQQQRFVRAKSVKHGAIVLPGRIEQGVACLSVSTHHQYPLPQC